MCMCALIRMYVYINFSTDSWCCDYTQIHYYFIALTSNKHSKWHPNKVFDYILFFDATWSARDNENYINLVKKTLLFLKISIGIGTLSLNFTFCCNSKYKLASYRLFEFYCELSGYLLFEFISFLSNEHCKSKTFYTEAHTVYRNHKQNANSDWHAFASKRF